MIPTGTSKRLRVSNRREDFSMFDQAEGLAGENCIGPGMLGLWYDPDRLVIEGVYQDEVTAYRAKRRWMEALEHNFLLEDAHDFAIKVKATKSGKNFRARCDFLTACGRYAFWRLTHHQAPEVQFLLETAHLPNTIPTQPSVVFDEEDDALCAVEGVGAQQYLRAEDAVRRTILQRVIRTIHDLAEKMSSLTRQV